MINTIRHIFFTFLILFGLSGYVNAESIQSLAATQSELDVELTAIAEADPSERLFLEDVLQRKNVALRVKIASLVDKDADNKEFEKLVKQQILFLDNLLEHSKLELIRITKLTRKAKGSERTNLEFEAQKRIETMGTYYSEIVDTIEWGSKIGLQLSDEEALLKEELQERAEFLYNGILYLETKQKDVKKRLGYALEENKTELVQASVKYTELVALMVASLESTTSLMETYKLDTTEYRQLIFSVTGDINSDVLDFNIALGLLEEWASGFKDWAFDNTPSIIVKVLVFCLILWIAKSLSKVAAKAIKKSVSHSKMNFSHLMQDFFVSIGSKAVMFIGILIALSQLGIELAPLLTGFGVAGVIIGFALQDTLSNFASGLMILIYRPFDVDDMVEVASITGKVSHMSLVSTTVKTIDNQILVIPNNKIWGDVIKNITAETVRRVDMVFGIGYQDDIDKAKAVFAEILEAHPLVLKSPEPMIKLHVLNESSVDFVVRPWVKTDDYWDVYWDVTETVKKRLDSEGITIPFPQRDVHLYQHQVDNQQSENT